jgi:hypothetical protein
MRVLEERILGKHALRKRQRTCNLSVRFEVTRRLRQHLQPMGVPVRSGGSRPLIERIDVAVVVITQQFTDTRVDISRYLLLKLDHVHTNVACQAQHRVAEYNLAPRSSSQSKQQLSQIVASLIVIRVRP